MSFKTAQYLNLIERMYILLGKKAKTKKGKKVAVASVGKSGGKKGC